MQDRQPSLLLTRPKAQSVAFLSDCEKQLARRLPAVISPIMRIKLRDVRPNLESYESLIFTSANGVVACGDELEGRRVFTVGTKTCEMAVQYGALARSLGEDVDSFVDRADEIIAPALHCRGAHARGALAERLNANGMHTDEAILYDQVAQQLTDAARALLKDSTTVVAPLFSPRSARLLCESTIRADMKIIAMSDAVANAWTGPGSIDIVSAPTAANMALQTIRYF